MYYKYDRITKKAFCKGKAMNRRTNHFVQSGYMFLTVFLRADAWGHSPILIIATL